MSASIKRYSTNLSFFWVNKFRNRVRCRRFETWINFRNLGYHHVQNHTTISEVVDYNQFFEDVILPRVQTVLNQYNNSSRIIEYRINLDLMIQHPRTRLSILTMNGPMENDLVSYFNLDQRLKSKRSFRHCFVKTKSPWRSRGSILLQVAFFHCQHELSENRLEFYRPVRIEDTYTYARQQ
jgi:hypothetical protein